MILENNGILTVTELNLYIKNIFENNSFLSSVTLKGEISNFKHHSTGHMYMSLKDETGVIRAVMFRYAASGLDFKPENGMKVIVKGRVAVYERDGQYQVYIDRMQRDGLGEKHIAFEKLKAKLSAEGLFDAKYKKPIPKYPRKIGVVTAPTGAAIRDILNILSRRFKYSDVVLYPVLVQGQNAAESITEAIEFFNRENYVDVMIIGRGGGSIEDLWAFNEEIVARAVFKSKIPVISAVGHEIDFTISDFVADLRAPTPSAAAELVVPDKNELCEKFNNVLSRMNTCVKRIVENKKLTLKYFKDNSALKNASLKINEKRMYLDSVSSDFENICIKILNEKKQSLSVQSSKLDGLSPLGTLARGFSLSFKEDGSLIKSVSDISVDSRIDIKLSDGTISAVAEKIDKL